MKRLTKKEWFGPKKYLGWGWTPVSFEGYAVCIIYAILFILLMLFVKDVATQIALIVGLTIVLIITAALTGSKPGGPSWHK